MPRFVIWNRSQPAPSSLSSRMRMQVRYAGRVQGVGFRATVQSIATRHSATGWVRNEPDGSVLMEIQGTSEHVHAALDELRVTMSRHIHSETPLPLADSPGELDFQITQ